MKRNSLNLNLEKKYNNSKFNERKAPLEVNFIDDTFAVGYKKYAKPTVTFQTGIKSIYQKGIDSSKKYFPNGINKS